MECFARLGLIQFVGKQTEHLIFLVDTEYQLALAIILVLGVCSIPSTIRLQDLVLRFSFPLYWQVSALTSSVVDSVPVTAMMVKIVVSITKNSALHLPIQPLVWALAYGPTLGGNCSLYGASSNIVCATIAEKLGHKITFFQYLKSIIQREIVRKQYSQNQNLSLQNRVSCDDHQCNTGNRLSVDCAHLFPMASSLRHISN